MQKVIKHAIKFILILMCASYTSAQVNEDYYFLDKTIQLTKQSNDSIYYLGKRNNGSKYFLKKYYNFRFKDKPFYTTFTHDTITDCDGIDTLDLEGNRVKWKAEYKLMDSVFTKKDIEQIIKTKTITKWDSTHIVFNKKRDFYIKWSKHSFKNFISKPYYNSKRNFTFLIHKKRYKTSLFIYKKIEERNWILIDKIEYAGY